MSKSRKGFRMTSEPLQQDSAVDSLGLFIPRRSAATLQKLSDKEHEFLQAMMLQINTGLGQAGTAESEQERETVLAGVRTVLKSASTIKSLSKVEAEELVTDMLAAFAAVGLKKFLVTQLTAP